MRREFKRLKPAGSVNVESWFAPASSEPNCVMSAARVKFVN